MRPTSFFTWGGVANKLQRRILNTTTTVLRIVDGERSIGWDSPLLLRRWMVSERCRYDRALSLSLSLPSDAVGMEILRVVIGVRPFDDATHVFRDTMPDEYRDTSTLVGAVMMEGCAAMDLDVRGAYARFVEDVSTFYANVDYEGTCAS